jgi:hypothetical protein
MRKSLALALVLIGCGGGANVDQQVEAKYAVFNGGFRFDVAATGDGTPGTGGATCRVDRVGETWGVEIRVAQTGGSQGVGMTGTLGAQGVARDSIVIGFGGTTLSPSQWAPAECTTLDLRVTGDPATADRVEVDGWFACRRTVNGTEQGVGVDSRMSTGGPYGAVTGRRCVVTR